MDIQKKKSWKDNRVRTREKPSLSLAKLGYAGSSQSAKQLWPGKSPYALRQSSLAHRSQGKYVHMMLSDNMYLLWTECLCPLERSHVEILTSKAMSLRDEGR